MLAKEQYFIAYRNFHCQLTNYNDGDVSNDELDREIRIAAREFRFYRIRRMKGYLRSKRIRVSWQRIRESMWRIDPDVILLKVFQHSYKSSKSVFSTSTPLFVVLGSKP